MPPAESPTRPRFTAQQELRPPDRGFLLRNVPLLSLQSDCTSGVCSLCIAHNHSAAASLWRGRWPRLRLVIVPRHPERFDEVARHLDLSGIAWRRRTELDKESPDKSARVLLVDVVGELGYWWGTAQIAFVGGSFGNRGGQNMIEPAAYGAAVSFGPNTQNFRDIVATLLDRDAAVVVRGAEELEAFVQRCLEDPQYATDLGGRAKALVAEQLGATGRTVELLGALVASRRPKRI